MNVRNFFAPGPLTAEDFVVRGYKVGDGKLLAPALNASYRHLKTYMPWAKPQTSVAEAERTARRFCAQYITGEDFPLAILAPDESRLLGSSGFHLREGGLENRAAEIGMWIHVDAAGQGLGTRVLRALLAWGFDAWPWERLAWRCRASNIASRRTAEKAGMTLEGRLRARDRLPDGSREDILCFAALKGEWTEKA